MILVERFDIPKDKGVLTALETNSLYFGFRIRASANSVCQTSRSSGSVTGEEDLRIDRLKIKCWRVALMRTKRNPVSQTASRIYMMFCEI
jgi:hypothetical protein